MSDDNVNPIKVMNSEPTIFDNKINQQYSYTTAPAIAFFEDRLGNFDRIPSKEGQTIEQYWLDRITHQRSASNLVKEIPLGVFAVHENDDQKLDDKIRKHIEKFDYHIRTDYEEEGFIKEEERQGTEWILTDVSDLYDELNFYPECVDDILSNKEFMKLWFERIRESKYTYFNDDDTVSNVYKLRPWQQKAVTEMLGSEKTYHQLGLAARFGKTLTVLDYTKNKIKNSGYDEEKIFLVPTSKSLSSNQSFVNDYTGFGFHKYFNILEDISLFKEEDKIIDKMKETLPSDAQLILVTDEGDYASHTEISTDKIELIKDNFNVVEQIVMTGTGIGKAAKIFKNIPSNEINFIYVPYSEMVEMGGDVVKRNILNIQYDIEADFDENVLNIRKTLEDPAKHDSLIKYIEEWTLDSKTEKRFNLQPTDASMVFFRPASKGNKPLHQLVKAFEKKNKHRAKCLCLTGSGPSGRITNRTAEKRVEETLRDMRKLDDNRMLIVFSTGSIGSRSFSVSEIYREINFSDSELTTATVQEMARPLTWESGKEVADIIRIGFSPMNLAEELYLLENEIPDYKKKSKERVGRFLTNNSFTDIVFQNDGSIDWRERYPDGVDAESIGSFLDKVCEFTDRTSYISTRLWGEGLVVDVDGRKSSKAKTSSISNSSKGKKIKSKKSKDGSDKLTSKDEKKLKQYVDIVRCIPSFAQLIGISDLEEFVNSSFWNDYLELDKQIFSDNYKNSSEFREIVNSLFRYSKNKSKDEHKKRLAEYMEFRG